MLRKIRIALATVMFIGITLLFLDFTGTMHQWVSWMPKIQFLEAVLALNVVVIAALLVLTLIFGRIYCSVICPLGILQDAIAWLGKKTKKNRYTASKALSWLRYTMLGVFVVALVAGIGSIFQLLEPYSAFGRIATTIFQPIWKLANNGLAAIAEGIDSYAFYSVDVLLPSFGALFGIAGIRLPGQGAVIDLCFVRGHRRDGEPHPSASPPRQESWDTPSACGGHPMTKDTPSACGGHPKTSPKRGRQHGLPPAFSRGTGFRPPFRRHGLLLPAFPQTWASARLFAVYGLPPAFPRGTGFRLPFHEYGLSPVFPQAWASARFPPRLRRRRFYRRTLFSVPKKEIRAPSCRRARIFFRLRRYAQGGCRGPRQAPIPGA